MTDIGIPPRSPQAWDVPPTVVEAEAHLQGLLAHPVLDSAPLKQRHDWCAAVFRDLATVHPEACTPPTAIDPAWAAWLDGQIAKSDYTRTERTRGGAS